QGQIWGQRNARVGVAHRHVRSIARSLSLCSPLLAQGSFVSLVSGKGSSSLPALHVPLPLPCAFYARNRYSKTRKLSPAAEAGPLPFVVAAVRELPVSQLPWPCFFTLSPIGSRQEISIK